jgi:anti-anti-sigma factor
VAVVECRGEHDLTTKAEMSELLERLLGENDLVVVDVSEAAFVDSSFLHALLEADRDARLREKRFRLQVGSAALVKKAIEYSRVLNSLDHARTREDAIK